MEYLSVYQAGSYQNLSITMQKKLAKELGRVNIRSTIRLKILTTHEFDMGNPG